MSSLKDKIIEEHFFRPRWYSVFINPYFINRFTLYKSIQSFAHNTPRDVKILDVGCGLKPYRELFSAKDYVGIDIEGGGHADQNKVVDHYYNGTQIPFLDNSFNTIICTQVLEHADDPNALISECSRVLQKGSRAFFSMPFTYPEHEIPYDFRRYTRFEHKRLFEKNGFSNVTIVSTTGFFGTFGQLFVVWVFESIPFRSTILKTALTVFFFAPIQIVTFGLDKLFKKSGMTMDYVIMVEK